MSDNPIVGSEAEDELLSSHNYDGIQEYDNPTPGWWNWLFIATIAFAPFYILWFHSPTEPHNLEAQYDAAYAANMKLKFGDIQMQPTEAELVKYMHDEEWVGVGAATFATHCKQCHGAKGEGIVGSGPNLTDERYINVKKIEDIAKVIQEGAKNGAMPAWGNRLHPNEVVLAAAYVASLRGENLDGKPAEGDEIPPWPEPTEDVESKSGEKSDEQPTAEGEEDSDDNAEQPADK
ncbi:c-type cytochrome [Aeoliella sp. ICT_H6.2]|uniref:C-type cytochrome n=1 Tax=Aeoliella straminimaris TaxID=2954799 RepID=A0A9X2FJA3_9BACT|nr:cbb3-type cytochrome c oxidase N-terminal domain-containing protein [Aeoliella straminimaris]MCO6048021.1 c-type cytochrome [Aeoliella straminimaris]